ncbi:MAG: tRNA (adenosine(37)-N6)-threonylcarbamoyltransferase complex transferase subunit TsaD [Vampirovibrionales bacterium]|nr:tRNA (adenosine(37)-N6)-threonylcarbamoyltransferase complex transferase subunit TsaD [Vampirovibrionales bacterium]
MKILALETSCDDTAVAIVEDGRRVLSSVICSQIDLHMPTGGVVPEAAARDHLLRVNQTLQDALKEAGLDLDDIDAFAATLGPGLVGSLLVGANTAKTLSFMTQKPFLGVNHLHAHVASNYLDSDLEPPFLCLLVSGGHTQLIAVESYEKMRLLGETLDDAVGEAYDKVARLMGLPYPGGPHLDKLAQSGKSEGIVLPKARTEGAYDFSFSGLKTAMLRLLESEARKAEASLATVSPADLAAGFQKTVVETLADKTLRCLKETFPDTGIFAGGKRTLAIAGGVSANSGLRGYFLDYEKNHPDFKLYIPKMRFCTDNAAMVASAAYFNPLTTDLSMEVFSRCVSFS